MAAGEFGQMVIVATDSPERSDRPGCLERLVANPAVCERYNALERSAPSDAAGETVSQVRRICQLAMAGDSAAMKAIRETCRYLGIGIANVVWGLDADAVIFDGTLAEDLAAGGALDRRAISESGTAGFSGSDAAAFRVTR